MDIAPVGLRIAGGVIDLVFSVVLLSLFGWLSGLGETYEQETKVGVYLSGGPFLLGCLLVVAVFAVMEATLGRTPGKFLVGTRVTDAFGAPVAFLPALVRNLLRFIDGIALYLVGLVIMAIDGENRRLGDFVARTRVVRND